MTTSLPPSIPVYLLTGFLGSGKTTLLNRMLAQPGPRTAIIVNEYGDMPIDNDLVRVDGGEASLATTTTGCICCEPGSDVVSSLDQVSATIDEAGVDVARVIVETTGLADPAPIINQLLRAERYSIGGRMFFLAGVIATLDAVRGEGTVEERIVGHKQVAFADRIAITKSDLHGEDGAERMASLYRLIARINPGAHVLDVQDPLAQPELLLAEKRYAPGARGANVEAWLAAENPVARAFGPKTPGFGFDRHTGIFTKSIALDGEVDPKRFSAFLDMLLVGTGDRLLRMKGLVALKDDPDRPVLVHAVQNLLHPLHRLDAWPSADRRTRLVFITDGIDEHALESFVQALVPKKRRASA